MEEKLAEYRARKAKEHEKYRSDTSWQNSLMGYIGLRNRDKDSSPSSTLSNKATVIQDCPTPQRLDDHNHVDLLQTSSNHSQEIHMPLTRREKLFNMALLALKIILWIILWALFLEIGFGAVFFIVSSLIIIYRTMKSGSRDRSKLSAYSVFNPNFERLEGTFTAEQFEKELRFGAGAVR